MLHAVWTKVPSNAAHHWTGSVGLLYGRGDYHTALRLPRRKAADAAESVIASAPHQNGDVAIGPSHNQRRGSDLRLWRRLARTAWRASETLFSADRTGLGKAERISAGLIGKKPRARAGPRGVILPTGTGSCVKGARPIPDRHPRKPLRHQAGASACDPALSDLSCAVRGSGATRLPSPHGPHPRLVPSRVGAREGAEGDRGARGVRPDAAGRG